MTSTTLYRKYRPQTFKEVLGQDHIISVLLAQIKNKQIGHAYLFSGSRGTGKTSVARILAREIGTTEKDLYEIDGASNRGIDDIRELREAVRALPFDSLYKVYIIDEVHMLTKEAFNALLKTLEEPPEHVVFILATTEVHKVPDTILSRCELHTFRKPTQDVLRKHIVAVAKKEGYSLETSSAELIAFLAEGSFRDAQGILQKIISVSKDKVINVDEVQMITGAPKGELVNEVLSANNIQEGLSALKKIQNEGVDALIFTKLLLEKMRIILLIRFSPDSVGDYLAEYTDTDKKFLEEVAKNKDSYVNSASLRAILDIYSAVSKSVIPYLPLELVFMDILQR